MSGPSGVLPCVHVLLASYQGARYIREQLESITRQSHTNWTLTVSDDGSTDDTVALCEAFAREHGDHRVRLIRGPGRRSTANFMHLVRAVEPGSGNDLIAFSDQDDVWLPEKLARAVTAIGSLRLSVAQPALYAARTQLVDENLKPIGISRLPQRPLGFGNALLQNVASGNTMVFNQPLLRLMRRVKPEHAVLHDWTAYQVVTGCGGHMHFDPEPCLLYRQHDHNLIGSQGRSWDKVLRMGMLFKGQYRAWGDQTEAAMGDIASELQPKAQEVLRKFQDMRRRPDLIGRMQAGRHSGLWRQTRSGRASFWLGLALNQL